MRPNIDAVGREWDSIMLKDWTRSTHVIKCHTKSPVVGRVPVAVA
jgi:hypothetical protein